MRSDPLQSHLKKIIKDDRDVSQLRAESSALLCDVTRAFVLELAERLVTELGASGSLSPDAFKAMLLAEPTFAPLHSFIEDMTVLDTKAMLRKRKKTAPTAAASAKRAKQPAPAPEPVASAPLAIAEDDDYDASD